MAAEMLFGLTKLRGVMSSWSLRLIRSWTVRRSLRKPFRISSDANSSMVRSWADVEKSLTAWRGAWLGGSVGHLSRSNQAEVKSWERALRLCGFAPYQTGLWLRPANLRSSVDALRARLLALGYPDDGLVLEIASLTPSSDAELAALWPIADLEQSYRTNLQRLSVSEALLPELDADTAARETLVVGRMVTRDILLDPLLPSQLIDTQLRTRMIQAMKRYDRLGRRIWRDFYQRHGGANARQPLQTAER